jgi:hypothetical protein
MAGLGANFEYDLRRIIALSTLRQLGRYRFYFRLMFMSTCFVRVYLQNVLLLVRTGDLTGQRLFMLSQSNILLAHYQQTLKTLGHTGRSPILFKVYQVLINVLCKLQPHLRKTAPNSWSFGVGAFLYAHFVSWTSQSPLSYYNGFQSTKYKESSSGDNNRHNINPLRKLLWFEHPVHIVQKTLSASLIKTNKLMPYVKIDAICWDPHKTHKCIMGGTHNFWMFKLVVHKVSLML